MKRLGQLKSLFTTLGVVGLATFFLCLNGISVEAAGENATSEAAVVSSRTAEDAVYIYIKGVEDIASGTTVQVGNTLCENIQVARVDSMGMPVKTTILFDNSQSLSKRWGNQAKELLTSLIDSHMEGEEFRLATFADGLNVISDFSTDYETLKFQVDGIEFLNQDSYLSDILYELLTECDNNEEANYTRFIIVTDGADDNDIKYTQTELSELMKASGVVIHTVGVKTSNNNTLLETLFSYARFSGGIYSTADSGTEVESLKNMMNQDCSMLCLRLVPDTSIMDGSRKEAKLTIQTSNGEKILTTSLKMPFADVNSTQSSVTDEESVETDQASETETSKLPTIELETSGEAAETEGETGVNIIAIIMVVVFVIGVAAFVVVIVARGKKKGKMNAVVMGPENDLDNNSRMSSAEQPQNTPVQSAGHTVRLGAGEALATGGHTMRLQGGPTVRQTYVGITDINNPQRNYKVPIESSIIIGREEGEIILGFDATVSYRHCQIIKKGNLFYVKDLNSSNGTFYENERVYNETPIMSGGILKLGSYKYKITIEC